MDEIGVHQPQHDLVAQAPNVHGVREVFELLQPLRRAETLDAVGAVGDGLAFLAEQWRVTEGARGGRRVGLLRAVTQLHQRLGDAGDHVAVALHHHRVADAQIFAGDLVEVEERGGLHHHAADGHGRQARVGDHRAGAADIDEDLQQLRVGFDGGEFVGDGPARVARHHAELLLLPAVVDLDHRAVNVEGDAEALLLALVAVRLGLLQRRHRAGEWTDREAPGGQPGQHFALAGRLRRVADRADLVGQEGERACGGATGIFLAQRARGGVAGVGEEARRRPGTQRFLLEAGVERLEVRAQHIDLAANLYQLGQWGAIALAQSLRHVLDGAHVGRDVLADSAVAAGQGLGEPAALVDEVHAEAIDFRLADVGEDGVGQQALGALLPGAQLVGRAHVGEAEHRRDVAHLGEGGGGLAHHALRWRIGRHERGVRRFERLQLAHQVVVLGVRHDGAVADVIGVGGQLQARAQLLGALAHVVGKLVVAVFAAFRCAIARGRLWRESSIAIFAAFALLRGGVAHGCTLRIADSAAFRSLHTRRALYQPITIAIFATIQGSIAGCQITAGSVLRGGGGRGRARGGLRHRGTAPFSRLRGISVDDEDCAGRRAFCAASRGPVRAV